LARLALARLALAWSTLFRLTSALLTLARLTLAQRTLARLSPARLTLSRLILTRLILSRLTLVQLILALLTLAPLTLTWLTLAWLTLEELTRTLARLTMNWLILTLSQLVLVRLTLVRLTTNPLTFAQMTPDLTNGMTLLATPVTSPLAIVKIEINVISNHVVLLTGIAAVKLAVIIDGDITVSCFHFKTNATIIVAAIAFVSAAPDSSTCVTTVILVNIDSDSTANITTDAHHGCGGLLDAVIVDSVPITATPDLVEPGISCPVLMSGSTSADSTAPA
jgi:hypothetical protein